MAGSVLVDAGFLIALLSRCDRHTPWVAAQSLRLAPPWKTCEAVLSEAFHLVGVARPAQPRRASSPRRRGLSARNWTDACLVRMSETLADPVIVTTDADFNIYRHHSRQVIPRTTLIG